MMYNGKTKGTSITEYRLQLSLSLYHTVSKILLPGPTLDLQITTDRLVQYLARTHRLDAHISMTMKQLPDRVHPTGSETKYHVFNNKITDNVDIYHSEATTLIPKSVYYKVYKNIRAHTVTTHIQLQNPEIIYKHLHTAHTNHTASNAINTFLLLHKVIQIAQPNPLYRTLHNNTIQALV